MSISSRLFERARRLAHLTHRYRRKLAACARGCGALRTASPASTPMPGVVEALEGRILLSLSPALPEAMLRRGSGMAFTGGAITSPLSDGRAPRVGGFRTVAGGELIVGLRSADASERISDLIRRAAPGEDGAAVSQAKVLFSTGDENEDGVTVVHIKLNGQSDIEPLAGLLKELPEVAWAAPNYVYDFDPREFTPNDPQFAGQYHHTRMQNTGAWDTTLGSSTVIIGITDDGVSLPHQDLAANIWVNTGEIAGNAIDDDANGYVDDVNGWDFISDDNNPNPNGSDAHGTHVAGIAAARTNNATGVAGTAGRATILPLKFYDGANPGAWTSAVIAETFAYAADNGAQVVSTSYNIDGFVGDPTFIAGLQYLYDNDVLHLNSAGNSSQLNPARQAFHQTLLVASTDSGDFKSSFSNYGTGIDVAAPGSSILSTLPGNAYGTNSGTSMATPNAAGVAALIWSAHPTWTRDQVAAQLVGTADNIDAQNPAYVGLLGGGRVNSFRGVTETLPSPKVKSLTGLPAEGSTTDVSPTSITLSFNQVMDPSGVVAASFDLRGDGPDNSFGTGDDVLIPVTLAQAYMIGSNSISATLGQTLPPDHYEFSLPAGLFDNPFGAALDGDGDGNGGDDFVRSFSITGPPLEPIEPLGSLIYDPPIPGDIAPGQTDVLTIDVDAGQTLTVVVDPAAGVDVQLTLKNTLGAVASTVDANGAGLDEVVQTATVGLAGTYTAEVTGISGTGAYTLQFILNAAVEDESHNGAGNDAPAAAQNLSGSFIDLTGAATRGAVLGAVQATQAVVDSETFESGALDGQWATASSNSFGRIRVTNALGAAAGSSIALIMDSSTNGNLVNNEAIWTVNLSGVGSPMLTFHHNDFNDEETALPLDFTGSVNGDGVSISDDGVSWRRILNATSVTTWTPVTVDLAAAAAAAGMTLGANFKIKFQQYDDFMTTTDGRGYDQIQITGAAVPNDDWYRFPLDDGQAASVVLAATSGAAPQWELYDASGTDLLALPVAGFDNVDSAIADFVDLTTNGVSDEYLVRVIGGVNGEYSLVVTRGATFELEPNDDVAPDAHDVTVTGQVLGSVTGGVGAGGSTGSSGSTSLPTNRTDGDAFLWDVAGNGSIGDGTNDAFDGGLVLSGFPTTASGSTEEATREIVIGPSTVGSVQVTRKIFVPADQGFARFLEIVTNNTATTQAHTVSISTNLGSDGGTVLVDESTGNGTFDANDDWVITDDADGSGDPTILHVIAGPGGLRPASASAPTGTVNYAYNLSLAPGETQIVMHFAAQSTNRAAAAVKSLELIDLGLNATSGMTSAEASQVVNFSGANDDYFSFAVNAGDNLMLTTSTPADGPFEFVNLLDPGLELFDPTGSPVLHTNVAGNETLGHAAAMTGLYSVRVFGEGGSAGEYVLAIAGNTGALPAFTVSATSPADGASLAVAPTQITVDFAGPLHLGSVDATDLTVDGVPASGVAIVDGDTLTFTVAAAGNGVHNVAIAGGALVSISAVPVDAYAGTFEIDASAPRVIASSIAPDDVVPVGNLTYTVQFDDELAAAALDASDVTLVGEQSGSHAVANFSYAPATSTATISFTGLPDDQYTLTLLSGNGRFESVIGLDLDGSPSFPLPSGDGAAGGDFVVTFSADAATTPYPTPLAAKEPLGSLIYDPSVSGTITTGDTDSYTINLDANQTVTLVAQSGPGLQATVTLLGPALNVIGTATASAAGQEVVLQTAPAAVAGVYTIEVTGTVSAPGAGGPAVWIAQGPGPSRDGQVENISPNDEVVGAMHTVLAHPTDANILYAGGTNGGVWKTTNATAASPTWVPLIDNQPSLSIGAMAFDQADPTRQTLWVGNGRYSSFGQAGGERGRLMRTTDGGATWTVFDGAGSFLGRNISGIVANGNTIVFSVNVADNFSFPNIGIFRSTNGGASFTQISQGNGTATGLPGGASYDLVADPTNPDVLYTSTIFSDSVGGVNGVFKSIDGGATWTRVSTAGMQALMTSSTSNVELAVGQHNNVYVSIINTGAVAGLFRSGDGGANWVQLETPTTNEGGTDVGLNPGGGKGPPAGSPPEAIAGGQGTIHFSMVADPNNANIVYVGGDRQPLEFQFPSSVGGTDYSGRLFRGDASQPIGSQWVHLTHSNALGPAGGGTASSSSPHADSREMVFDANGNIIEVDDGGIYRRTSPTSDTGDWFSIIGNLQSTEAHDVAYDNNANIIITGNQDTGTTEQIATGSTTYNSVSTADGGDVAVDNLVGGGVSIRYSSFQNLGSFRRRTVNAANVTTSTVFPALNPGADPVPTKQFVTPVVVNEGQANRLIIGASNGVYESFNGGDTVARIDTSSVNRSSGIPVAYGTAANPEALYVGSGANVLVRTTLGGALVTTTPPGGAQSIRDVEMDPDNYTIAFASDVNQVFHTINAGTNWTDITGDLFTSFGVNDYYALEFIEGAVGDAIFVGTERGVYYSLTDNLGVWMQLGTNLPNAPVWDMDYDVVDDVLVAGTLGRGAWALPDASDTLGVVGGNNYDLQLILNAAVEGEAHGGAGNNTPATSQNLAASFLSLGAGALDRAAALGTADAGAEDWYSFTLADGQSASLAVAGQNTGALHVQLWSQGGATLLASSVAAANVDGLIDSYVDQTTNGTPDTYHVRITGDVGTDYSLVVTRDGAFDTESNSDAPTAQDITASQAVLGHVSGGSAAVGMGGAAGESVTFGGGIDLSGLAEAGGVTDASFVHSYDMLSPVLVGAAGYDAPAPGGSGEGDGASGVAPGAAEASAIIGPIPVLQQFAGPGATGFIPPDPNAAAGPQHIVAMVNTQIAIYDKATGANLFQQNLNGAGGFFGSVGATTTVFDPWVLFDEDSQRFFAMGIDIASNTQSNVFLAVSTDATPTSGADWHKYKIDFTHDPTGTGLGSGAHFPDYEKMGVNDDAIWISGNYFAISSGSGVYAGITAIEKAPLLTGGAANILYEQHFSGFSVFPMQQYDDSAVQYFAEAGTGGGSTITIHAVRDVLTSPVRTTQSLPVPTYNAPSNVPQSGGGTGADAIDARIMSGVWRDGSMWFAHGAIDPAIGDGEDVARWYEVQTNNFGAVGGSPAALVQAGNVDPGPGVHAWMPSIAVDGNGNMAINFSMGGPSQFYSAGFTGRLASDPAGDTVLPVTQYATGLANYVATDGIGRNRWGDYSGLAVDPADDATFWAFHEYASTGNQWATRIASFQLQDPSDEDWYAFQVNAGDALTIASFTPGDGAGEFVNLADVGIELYAPTDSTTPLASAIGAGNGQINQVAAQSGLYRVKVFGEGNSAGEYVLSILGATGGDAAPAVTDMDPDDGQSLAAFPATVTLDFSESILLTSVSAGDVLIGGLPATALTAIDGDTLQFTINPAANVGDGVYGVQLAGGAVTDLQGNGVAAFAGTFVIDSAGPTVLSTAWNGAALPADKTLAAGPFTFEAAFSEALFALASPRRGPLTPGAGDIVVVNTTTGQSFTPASVNYDSNLSIFTANYGSLPEGQYTLTLISGAGAFEDLVGNDLDGEPIGPGVDGTPSGNGTPGGNYTISFSIDNTSGQSAASFTRLDPLGSLIAASTGNAGLVNSAVDQDAYTFFTQTGQGYTAVVTPLAGFEAATLTINGLPAPAAGEPAVLPWTAAAGGVASITIGGDMAAQFELAIYLNAATESQVGDSADGSELDITSTLVPVAGGGRYGVVGDSSPPSGSATFYQANMDVNPGWTLQNQWAYGIPLGLGGDPTSGATGANVIGYNLAGAYPNGLPSTYATTPAFSTLGAADVQLSFQRWLGIESSVFDQAAVEVSTNGTTWSTVWAHASSDFQDTAWSLHQFDISGIAANQPQVFLRWRMGPTDGSVTFSGWNIDDVLVAGLGAAAPDVDEYTLDLTGKAGQSIDVVLAGQDGADFSGQLLEILDPNGTTVLAAGLASPLGVDAGNYDLGVLGFDVPADGVYTIRVTSTAAGEYALAVTESLTFDSEPNDGSGDPLRSLDGAGSALGHLAGGVSGIVEPAGAEADVAAGNDDQTTRYVIQFDGSMTDVAVAAWAQEQGAAIAYRLHSVFNGAVIDVPMSAAQAMEAAAAWEASPQVVLAEADSVGEYFVTSPNDTLYPPMWALNNTGQTGGTADADIDAPEAWDLITDSSNVVVAIVDSGTNYNHPDLAPRMWTNPGEIPGNSIDDDLNGFVDDVFGIDPGSGDSDPMDIFGHGTHVSGTAAAAGNNALGTTGVNWNARIMSLAIGSTGPSTAAAIVALDYMTMMKNDGVNIVSSNHSYSVGPSAAFETAINASIAAGVVFVAAAGNSTTNIDTSPTYPASYTNPGIIVVAATDHNDALASFSNFGAASVDIGAPGVSILSTMLTSGSLSDPSGFGLLSGTSMASPHVAGAAALLAAFNPSWSVAQIKDQLLSGSDAKASLNGLTVSGGRLNLLGALTYNNADLGPTVLAIDPPAGAGTDLNVTAIEIIFSEPITPASALNPANYLLIEAGPNGTFDGGAGDDVAVPFTPLFDGSAGVTLALGAPYSPLPLGNYQLTIDGDSSIVGIDGNPLNTTTGPGGGSDTVHEFDVTFDVPAGGDLYEWTLAAGQNVAISTDTPFDGPGGDPLNDLDPRLVVYDPSGAPVAMDANGAPDGRNASVEFTAGQAGVYTIQVLAESGAGEYVLLTQTIVGSPPVAGNDAYIAKEDTPLTIAAPGVLANDADIDGDPLTSVLASTTANGSLTFNADGSFTYTPNPGYTGPDAFTYRANDGTADSNLATVAINVQPVLSVPIPAQSDVFLSVPFAQEVGSFTATGVTAGGVTVADTLTVNQYQTLFYLRLTSGAGNGLWSTIASNSASEFVLSNPDLLAFIAPSDTFNVYAHQTLASVLPDSLQGISFITSPSGFSRLTEIIVLNSTSVSINKAAESTFFHTAGEWRKVGQVGNFDNFVLPPDSGFILRNNTAQTLTFLASGDPLPPTLARLVPVFAGANDLLAVSGRAAPVTLAQLNLGGTPAFVTSSSGFNRADELFVFDNAAPGINKGASAVYYYSSGAWRKVGFAGNFDDELLPEGAVFFIRKKAGTPGTVLWTQTGP